MSVWDKVLPNNTNKYHLHSCKRSSCKKIIEEPHYWGKFLWLLVLHSHSQLNYLSMWQVRHEMVWGLLFWRRPDRPLWALPILTCSPQNSSGYITPSEFKELQIASCVGEYDTEKTRAVQRASHYIGDSETQFLLSPQIDCFEDSWISYSIATFDTYSVTSITMSIIVKGLLRWCESIVPKHRTTRGLF